MQILGREAGEGGQYADVDFAYYFAGASIVKMSHSPCAA
jgi:hypothetical protein